MIKSWGKWLGKGLSAEEFLFLGYQLSLKINLCFCCFALLPIMYIICAIKCLRHPSAKKLLFKKNSSLLLNKSHVSLQDVSYDCASYKMGKSKILPFPTQWNHHKFLWCNSYWCVGGLFLIFHPIVYTLAPLLGIIVDTFGSIFCIQSPKFLMSLNFFWPLSKINFRKASKLSS